jgi:metabolite-proton symporter
MAQGALDADVARRMSRRAIIAAAVGTSVEWYDFFLYTTVAALVIPKLFFPNQSPTVGLLASFSTYFVGFAARPVGAAIFGHYGDRLGRKVTLIATLLIMGVGTVLIGLLPPYQTIGIWGPVLLVLLRALQGIGIGGEWGGSVLLSIEWNTGNRRGFVASWPQFGVPVGLVLSNGAFLLFNWLSGPHFLEWGWRIPFLLSAVLIAVGLYIRLGILETPVFTNLVEHQRIETAPVSEVLVRHWREVVLSALARLGQNTQFYIFTGFVLVYGTTILHFQRGALLNATLVMSLISLVTVPLFGYLSDLFGRRRVYLIGCAVMVLFPFVYYGLLDTRLAVLVFLAIAISLPLHDLQYGPQAALIAESFTGRLRYSGASLGYQLASIIAGGPAPLVAVALVSTFHTSLAVAIYLAICAAISVLATLGLKDNRARDITVEYDLAGEPGRVGPSEAAARSS